MKIAKNLTHYKGLFFECFACLVLLIKGYKILKRDYKIKATAQIDILALKNDVIHLVEVKYRKNFEDCLYAISINQRKRIEKSAYVIANKYNKQVVVDAMFFSANWPFVKHFKNI